MYRMWGQENNQTERHFYFGYQKNQRGGMDAVKFSEDHVPSHRLVVSKHKISLEEFKWKWDLLRQKYPPPQQQESNNNAPVEKETTCRGT